MSLMVDVPPLANGITTIPLSKTKYGNQIAIVLPYIDDFDREYFDIEARVVDNSKIFFWYRQSPNYED